MYTQCYIYIAHFSNGWAKMLDGQDRATSQMQMLESSPDPIDLQQRSGLAFLEWSGEKR